MHYCLRISDKEFEKQRSTESKDALIELLDQIINSTTMSNKEKSKRIKLVSYDINDINLQNFVLRLYFKQTIIVKYPSMILIYCYYFLVSKNVS